MLSPLGWENVFVEMKTAFSGMFFVWWGLFGARRGDKSDCGLTV
jgi:hypothetical protein